MRVAELWRYPVKSLQGERVDGADVGPEGLTGDRQWALFDVASGFGLTARRFPDLLFASARLRPDGAVEVVLPDGTVTADDAVLSAWLGRPVELRAAADAPGDRRYENPAEVGEEDEYDWDAFTGARGAFHDSSRVRVSLVSTGTLGTWDRRRFRANVLLDGEGEDALVGTRVRLGDAELDVVKPIDRCVMVTRPQPGGIGRDTGVLRTVHRERGGTLAIGALVVRPGRVTVGDEVDAVS
ncbi:MOSC domain-containing protein [Geodermatophilus sp. SYSU D00697]